MSLSLADGEGRRLASTGSGSLPTPVSDEVRRLVPLLALHGGGEVSATAQPALGVALVLFARVGDEPHPLHTASSGEGQTSVQCPRRPQAKHTSTCFRYKVHLTSLPPYETQFGTLDPSKTTHETHKQLFDV
ncbi:hypothetical protein HPB49_012004 [Dermacentor silvarum]|uniref:Uncharacterized protein n=1 Tax=Dermacentor silvarum TaxID=543639 RepID=A0ACB8C3E8_DERSI|nr:hypothetical protein HPB49_012004 [Dermacentor silvarum]